MLCVYMQVLIFTAAEHTGTQHTPTDIHASEHEGPQEGPHGRVGGCGGLVHDHGDRADRLRVKLVV